MIYLSLDNFAPHSLSHTHAGEAEAIRFLISPSTSCEDIKPHHELLRWGSMWGPEMVVSSTRQCSVDNLTYLESFKSRLITFYARSLGLARYYREKNLKESLRAITLEEDQRKALPARLLKRFLMHLRVFWGRRSEENAKHSGHWSRAKFNVEWISQWVEWRTQALLTPENLQHFPHHLTSTQRDSTAKKILHLSLSSSI